LYSALFKTLHSSLLNRNLSWAEIATVDQVKTVAKYWHYQYSTQSRKVTVNDVFASCVSAAIARLVAYHRGVLMGSD
jgi:hypothetical protein